MKSILLSDGLTFAYVDKQDFDLIRQYVWYLNKNGYAYRWDGSRPVALHVTILGHREGLEIDHKDRNKLNNCRYNLRHVTHAVNQLNRKLPSGQTRNINFNNSAHGYQVQFKRRGKLIFVGTFQTFDKALIARNEWLQRNEPEHDKSLYENN
jgi:hypothetical protein